MIGATYQALAIQAVLGPARSELIPAVLHGAWLDGSKVVLSMTGNTVSHEIFGETATGVTNISDIDAGLAPASTPAFFALMDAAGGGAIVAAAAVTFNVAPTPGDPLTIEVGVLAFNYGEPA